MRHPAARYFSEPRAPATDRPAPIRTLETLPSLAAADEFIPTQATNALDDEVSQLQALSRWWLSVAETRPWSYSKYFDASALCLFLSSTFVRDVADSPMGDEYQQIWPYASHELQDAWYNYRMKIGFTVWPAGAADHLRGLLRCVAAAERAVAPAPAPRRPVAQELRRPTARQWR